MTNTQTQPEKLSLLQRFKRSEPVARLLQLQPSIYIEMVAIFAFVALSTAGTFAVAMYLARTPGLNLPAVDVGALATNLAGDTVPSCLVAAWCLFAIPSLWIPGLFPLLHRSGRIAEDALAALLGTYVGLIVAIQPIQDVLGALRYPTFLFGVVVAVSVVLRYLLGPDMRPGRSDVAATTAQARYFSVRARGVATVFLALAYVVLVSHALWG